MRALLILLAVVAITFSNDVIGDRGNLFSPRDLRLYGTLVTTRVDYSREHITAGLIKADSPNIVRVFDTKNIDGSFKGLEKTNVLDDSHQVLFSIYSKNHTFFGISTIDYLTGEPVRPEFYFTGVSSIFCSFFDTYLDMIYIVGTRSSAPDAPIELMSLDVYAWKEIAEEAWMNTMEQSRSSKENQLTTPQIGIFDLHLFICATSAKQIECCILLRFCFTTITRS